MPGLKIIEIVLGLTFVYLLLSLLCTAINEYIAGMLNKRGRELFKAVDDMLGDDAVRDAFYRHPLITTLSPSHGKIRERTEQLRQRLWGTRWARRLAAWVQPSIRSQRLPSYLPARNFALALLNSTDYAATNLGVPGAPLAAAGSPPAAAGSPPAGGEQVAETPAELARLFDALMQESAADVSELLRDPAVAAILGSKDVPESVRATLTDISTGAERKLQKLQDAVEVWFNNAMDRVSGAYKRYTQIALLLIGFGTAALLNADTIQIWQTLATNDEIREAVVQRAIAFNTAANAALADSAAAAPPDSGQAAQPTTTDSVAATPARDTTCTPVTGDSAQRAVAKALSQQRLTCGEARTVIAISRAELDSTQLGLGWSRTELLALGLVKEVPDSARANSTRRDSAKAGAALQGADSAGAAGGEANADGEPELEWQWPWDWNRSIWVKLLGLILTAIAVSLGAPFWFDMLNKIINIRAAGRAPDERPKNPEARDKRLAGQAPR